MTGAAPPPSSVLKKIDEQGFNITHTYGLTEVYGPAPLFVNGKIIGIN